MNRWNLTPIPPRVSERAITRVIEQEDGCWISTYSVGNHGYAQIGWTQNGKNFTVLAHRAAWTHVEGEVPPDMTLDHTCKTRRCVNPLHLRLLSNLENARRNNGSDWPLNSGTCRHGHDDSLRVPMLRRTKTGAARMSSTCGPCMDASRERWKGAHPDHYRKAG